MALHLPDRRGRAEDRVGSGAREASRAAAAELWFSQARRSRPVLSSSIRQPVGHSPGEVRLFPQEVAQERNQKNGKHFRTENELNLGLRL